MQVFGIGEQLVEEVKEKVAYGTLILCVFMSLQLQYFKVEQIELTHTFFDSVNLIFIYVFIASLLEKFLWQAV